MTENLKPRILHIALYKPLRRYFDYLLPASLEHSTPQPGCRVQVPFGKKQLVGMILKVDNYSALNLNKLRPITALIDQQPILPKSILALYEWASLYYQHAIGDVILGTLPQLLRQTLKTEALFQVTDLGLTIDLSLLKKVPRQRALLELLIHQPSGLTYTQLKEQGFSKALLNKLMAAGWLASQNSSPIVSKPHRQTTTTASTDCESPLALNNEQALALQQISNNDGFQPYVLEGVTGSGKTEVYLQAIEQVIRQGKQALVLVPEIGLTPQTVKRFAQRFAVAIAALHSGLSDKARARAWLDAQSGKVRIIIGTRSAIFIPLKNPGILIIDEEHDLSFKQQSGFRYSARDLAIVRAKLESLPVILGSATPSLETLNNVLAQRYHHLQLSQRAGNALPPSFHLIDLRNQALHAGLSGVLLQAIAEHLARGNQVLLFLNRRGYAPLLLCHSCGWSATCRRCDAKLTLHQHPAKLLCHHCLASYRPPLLCGQCQTGPLLQLGMGTERLELELKNRFPERAIIRIDRDSIRHKGAMEKALEEIHQGRQQILIGTQMLTKGHHFPNVTLVGIIDADWGLYNPDFRSLERMGQLIVQVAGRAGRAEKPGQVYIQTHHPAHPLLQTLIQQGYASFANHLLAERRHANWPPYSFLALLRAEANTANGALNFLKHVSQLAQSLASTHIQLLGPIPAPMERKGGQFRGLLLFQAAERNKLQQWLTAFIPLLEQEKASNKIRWSLEIDPLEIA